MVSASLTQLNCQHHTIPPQRMYLSSYSNPPPTHPAYCKELQRKAKSDAYQTRRQHETTCANDLCNKIPRNQQRAPDASKEKGASSWLSSLSIAEYGFALHKGAFRDALCLRYGWRPPHLPSNCVCGKQYTNEHALSYACGGLPSIRHNQLPDITAQLLTEACHSVGTEPLLQNAFFDVRVFNPYAPSHHGTTLAQCYRRHEQEKKRAYEEKVREVEHGSFSPLIFSTSIGMGPIATVVYKRIATLIAEKHDQPLQQNSILDSLQTQLLTTALCHYHSDSNYSNHPIIPTPPIFQKND